MARQTKPRLCTQRSSSPLVLAALLLASCSPDYDTQQLRIVLDDSLPGRLCEGDLQHYQGEVDRIEHALGIQMRRRLTVELYQQDTGCRAAEACYDGTRHRVRANAATLSHELVHGVTRDGRRRKNLRFFDEGIAVALESHVRFPRRPSLPSDNVDFRRSNEIHYATAGHFTRWLLEERGSDDLRALLRGETFDDVYGEPLETAEQRWLATAPWLFPELAPCPYPQLPQSDEGWRGSIALDCELDGVRASGQVGLGACRTFDVARPGPYWLVSDLPGVMGRCQVADIVDPPPIEAEAVPARHNFNRPVEGFAAGEREVLLSHGMHYLCVDQIGSFDPTDAEVSLEPTSTTLVRP